MAPPRNREEALVGLKSAKAKGEAIVGAGAGTSLAHPRSPPTDQ